jgi:hypothetical protein
MPFRADFALRRSDAAIALWGLRPGVAGVPAGRARARGAETRAEVFPPERDFLARTSTLFLKTSWFVTNDQDG